MSRPVLAQKPIGLLPGTVAEGTSVHDRVN